MRVENVGVQNCGGDGIRFKRGNDGSQVTILRCVVRDNQRTGVRIDEAARVRIEGCQILNNGLEGKDGKGYGILSKHSRKVEDSDEEFDEDEEEEAHRTRWWVTLVGNTVEGNHGRVIEGRSDRNFGNYNQMIFSTD